MAGGWNNQLISLLILIAQASGFSGLFAYSPSPGYGNLIFSVSVTGGEDDYGNPYYAGAVSYNEGLISQLFSGGVAVTWLANAEGLGGPGATVPGGLLIEPPASDSDSCAMLIQGPSAFPNSTTYPVILLFGQSEDGTQQPLLAIQNSDGSALPITTSGSIYVGSTASPPTDTDVNGTINTANMNVLTGGGPFIPGETWHNVTPPTDCTGLNRYKLTPMNLVIVDIQLGYTGAGGNITCMTLPSGYRPTQQDISEPMWLTTSTAPGAWTETLRMTISTAGVVATSSLPADTTNFGCTLIFPNN
jgi:hypothetical protein